MSGKDWFSIGLCSSMEAHRRVKYSWPVLAFNIHFKGYLGIFNLGLLFFLRSYLTQCDDKASASALERLVSIVILKPTGYAKQRLAH